MKRLGICLFSMFLMLALTQTVKAGDDDDGKSSHFGVRAGWQWSLLNGSGGNSDRLSSMYIGAYREHKLIPLLRYSYGLEYAQMGGDLKSAGDYRLNYIGVPIYLKGKLGPVYALAGTALNLKISESGGNFDKKADTFDMPIFIGGGFKILIVSVEVRYGWGLFEVQETAKNEYMQLGLTLSF